MNREPNDLSGWFSLVSGMSLAIFLLVTAILFIFVSALYIPLPYELCDRQKIQFFEFALRLSNEHLVSFNFWMFFKEFQNFTNEKMFDQLELSNFYLK